MGICDASMLPRQKQNWRHGMNICEMGLVLVPEVQTALNGFGDGSEHGAGNADGNGNGYGAGYGDNHGDGRGYGRDVTVLGWDK